MSQYREYEFDERDLFGNETLVATRVEGKHVHMLFLKDPRESWEKCCDKARHAIDRYEDEGVL